MRPTAVLALITLSAALLPCAPACAQRATSAEPANPAINQVVHALCSRQVALLGESPVHGFGRTLEFKAEVVRRLVDECHFRAFFIESGIYDFLNIRQRLASGREVTEPMIGAAIGGLWANREMERLIPFLLDKARSGAVMLGGMDDQLARGTYAQLDMPADLAKLVPGDAGVECLAILRKHTLWQYTAGAPYSARDKALILGCLDRIEAGLSTTTASGAASREDQLAMTGSLRRAFARDFADDSAMGVVTTNGRDYSMYLNFKWLMSRLPPGSKVIIWAATTHVAKELAGVPGQDKLVPMGSFIHREYGDRAFALGFSALSGSYAMVRQPVRPLSASPPASLESITFAAGDTAARFLDRVQLRKAGAIAARPTGVEFKTAMWDAVLDGLVVFREERPPDYAR